jgi:hypothetical protein
MQAYVRLQEEQRTRRRTIADALDVVCQALGLDETPRGEIRLYPLWLPSGECTTMVDMVFPGLGCIVSLPASTTFRARSGTGSQRKVFEISRLGGAEVCSDGAVQLADGTRLRGVEVIPTHLPYKPSQVDERIIHNVISLTKSYHCYRSMREGLPGDWQHLVPDLHALDYGRVRTIKAPPLKVIQAYIAENDPELKVSNQKIADALAMCGVRIPGRRPRAGSARKPGRATI